MSQSKKILSTLLSSTMDDSNRKPFKSLKDNPTKQNMGLECYKGDMYDVSLLCTMDECGISSYVARSPLKRDSRSCMILSRLPPVLGSPTMLRSP